MISFKTTAQDADRAQDLFASYGQPIDDRTGLLMDLIATNANGCPMDFQRLLTSPDNDFGHDISGIQACIDRKTGKLTKLFDPRSSMPWSES